MHGPHPLPRGGGVRIAAACAFAALLLASGASADGGSGAGSGGVAKTATAPSEAQKKAVTAAHEAWSAAYSKHEGEKAAALMSAEGIAVLDGGVRILSRDDVSTFITDTRGQQQQQQQQEEDIDENIQKALHFPFSGTGGSPRAVAAHGAQLHPLTTIAQSGSTAEGTILHTGGRNTADGSIFYTRLVENAEKEAGKDEKKFAFETVVMPGAKLIPAGKQQAAAPEWLRAAVHDMRRLFAAGDHSRVVSAYFTDNALALSPKGDAFATSSPGEMAAALRKMVPRAGFFAPHECRVVAATGTQDNRVYHVLVEKVQLLTGIAHRCYMRWESVPAPKPVSGAGTGDGSIMKIAVFAPAIGVSCAGEPCTTSASLLPVPMPFFEHTFGEIGDIFRKAFDFGADLAHAADAAIASAMERFAGDADAAAARGNTLKALSDAINAEDYTAAVKLHTKTGCVVPYGRGRLIAAGAEDGRALEEYLKNLHEKGGGAAAKQGTGAPATPMDLSTHRVTVQFDDGAHHTLGVNKADGGIYYVRWASRQEEGRAAGDAAPASETWEIATMAWGVGGKMAKSRAGEQPTQAATTTTPPPSWLAASLKKMADLYNSGDYGNLTAMFTSDAVVVPLDVTEAHLEMLGRGEVAGYFAKVKQALPGDVELKILDVLREDTIMIGEGKKATGTSAAGEKQQQQQQKEIWHMLGTATVHASGYSEEIYFRWVEDGGEWRVQTELVRVGARPTPTPTLHSTRYTCALPTDPPAMWSYEQREYCCTHNAAGCPQVGDVCRSGGTERGYTYDVSQYCPAGTTCKPLSGGEHGGDSTCQPDAEGGY